MKSCLFTVPVCVYMTIVMDKIMGVFILREKIQFGPVPVEGF